MKLFCIPYAGGSSLIYYNWKKTLDKNIELIPLELAGRGRRMNEPKYLSFHEIIEDVYSLIYPHIQDGSPFALFGHSMGGGVIYEVIERLRLFNVVHLFISGCRPPYLIRNEMKYETEEEMIQTLMKLGGTPIEALQDNDFIETFIPIIRSDFSNFFSHQFKTKKIAAPATILHGTQEECSIDEVLAWNECFVIAPKFEFFEGDHFFLTKFPTEVTQLVNRTLSI